MKNKILRTIALLLTLSFGIGMMSGCGKDAVTSGGTDTAFVTTDEYPIQTDEEITIRWWMNVPAQVTAYGGSMNDTEFHKFLEEATGVNIVFEHPVAGQEQAAFNILQSSDDMPDIIEYGWADYPGGPQKAIDDKVIIPLNDYIANVSPNLKKFFEENPDLAKQMVTDDGNYYQYPFARDDERLATFMTYIIRQDLLDQAGLEKPETLEEWETVLYKFKEMGVQSPISLRLSNYYQKTFSPFLGCFGIAGTFYHDENNQVKFGPYEPAYRDWVELMAKWYKDGILDQEFSSEDAKRLGSIVTNGEVGAIYCTIGGEFGNWLTSIEEGSGIKYAATKIPTDVKGTVPMYSQKDFCINNGAAISYTSKHKEIAARVLDYAYSEEGQRLYNYGKEGISYTMEPNEEGVEVPTYTDLVMDYEKNGHLTTAQALSKYCRGYSNGPYIQEYGYLSQYYQRQEQKDALQMLESDTLKYKLPILYLQGYEMQRYNDIMTTIDTYRAETIAKIIAGKLPLSEMDNYYAQLKSLGIEEAIEIQQKAYDRYLSKQLPDLG